MERSRMPEYAPVILTQDEVAEFGGPLDSMVHSVGWPLFVEILKRFRIQLRENLETAEDVPSIRYLKGMIDGLRLAENAPVELQQLVERQIEREETKERRDRAYIRSSSDPSF